MLVKQVGLAMGIFSLSATSFGLTIIGKEKGLYGRIEFGLSKEGWGYKNGISFNIDRSLFTQNYKFGYRGYLLNPRLISFDLGGSFRSDMSRYYNQGSETLTTLQGTGYKVDLRLLRGTRLPIHLYLNRSYKPTRVIAGNFQQDIDSMIETKGGSISFSKGGFFLSLSQNLSEVESIIQGIKYENNLNQRIASLSFMGDKARLGISYSDVDTKTLSPFYTYIDAREMFSASAGYSDDKFRISLRGSYNSSTLGNYEIYNENISLSYKPNAKFDTNFNVDLSQFRGDVKTDYYSFSQNSFLRITDTVTITQNANLYSLEKSKSYSLGGGVSYNKNLPSNLNFGVSLSSSYIRWYDIETRNYTSYSISGTLGKTFTSIRSSVFLNGTQTKLLRDGKPASDTFSINESFNSQIFTGVYFDHNVSFSGSTSTEYEYSYRMIRSGNSLSLKSYFFRNASAGIRIGIDYWKFLGKGSESVKPYININGSYSKPKKLISFNFEVYRDTLYKNEFSLKGNLNIRYTIRKVNIVLNNGINREVFRNAISYERSSYFVNFRIYRDF